MQPTFTPEPGSILVEDSLRVNVIALASRSVFGRELILIKPDSGSGEKWINADRFTPKEK